MKGYELIQKIETGEIKENTKIKVKTEDGYKTTISYENNGLKWKTGEFDTSILCSKNTEFELDEENKEIEELEDNFIINLVETDRVICDKLNEVTRAVNKLINKE